MADAKLIIKPPHMRVRMKPGYWPDLLKMQQTIRDAGYKPVEEGIELRVTGKVVKEGDRLALELDGMKAPLTLPVLAAKEHPDVALALEQKHLGQGVELEGRWQAPADGKGPGPFVVTAIAEPEEKGQQ